MRAREREPRKLEREQAKVKKALLLEKEAKADNEAREELQIVVSNILANNPQKTAVKHIGCLYRTYVLLEDDKKLQEVWPESTRCARDQWRCRGKKMVTELATPNLKRYLKKSPMKIRA